MIRSTAFMSRVLTAGLAAAALAGCVKKQPTEVSPSYVPEGTFSSQARLTVFPDLPTTLYTYFDKNPLGAGPEDSLIGTSTVQRGAPGVLRLMLFDGTQASAFELLRREAGGGYFSVNDFLLHPARKWIDGQREVYLAADDNPSSFSPATYIMRGMVAGEITPESPLTNPAIAGSNVVQPVTYTGISAPGDSLFTVSWAAVTGAAGYWVHVYQFLEAQRSDQVISGVPAPAYVDKVRDYFLGYVPTPITSYKLGDTPPEIDIYTRRTTLRGQVYLVRIAAVDANGALIAYTHGGVPYVGGPLSDYGLIPGEGLEYTLFPLGAKAINVRAATAPQARLLPAGARELPGVDLWAGDLPIVRTR
jgi:hypothetical protein